jgi:hypothetical protein
MANFSDLIVVDNLVLFVIFPEEKRNYRNQKCSNADTNTNAHLSTNG